MEQLGQGAGGTVFKAKYIPQDVICAVKVILENKRIDSNSWSGDHRTQRRSEKGTCYGG